MTDDEFVAAFEDQTLRPSAFRHADHVRLARIYLRGQPLLEATNRFATALKAYAAQIGKPGLYHETITYAFMMIINERLAAAPEDEDWEAFRDRNPDLFQNVRQALGRFYSEACLDSPRSRAGFVMPDRLAG